jgi:cell wall-associated NlpC family hydrolase
MRLTRWHAAVLGVGAVLAAAGAAQAATIKTSTAVRTCTNLADSSCKVTYGTVNAKTTVTMRCWRDDSLYAGSVRWFWIAGGGIEGFVPANYVWPQDPSPICSESRAIEAVRWAGTKLGHQDWVNECLVFVAAAWRYAGIDIGTGGTAYNYWKSNPRGYARSSSTNAPVGALVFWGPTPGYPEGHVAISIGAGRAISTYERSTYPVHVLSIADRNRTHPYVGYLMPR